MWLNNHIMIKALKIYRQKNKVCKRQSKNYINSKKPKIKKVLDPLEII